MWEVSSGLRLFLRLQETSPGTRSSSRAKQPHGTEYTPPHSVPWRSTLCASRFPAAPSPAPRQPPLPLLGAGGGGGSVRTRRRLRGGRGEAQPGGCLPGRGAPGQVLPRRRAEPSCAAGLAAAPRPQRRGCCPGARGGRWALCCCWARCCWGPPAAPRVSAGPALWGTKAGLGRGNTPVGKVGAVLGSGPGRRGLPARLGSSLRRVPPRQRRVLSRQSASGLRRRPVPQLADGAERPRRRAPSRWVRGRGTRREGLSGERKVPGPR